MSIVQQFHEDPAKERNSFFCHCEFWVREDESAQAPEGRQCGRVAPGGAFQEREWTPETLGSSQNGTECPSKGSGHQEAISSRGGFYSLSRGRPGSVLCSGLVPCPAFQMLRFSATSLTSTRASPISEAGRLPETPWEQTVAGKAAERTLTVSGVFLGLLGGVL